MKINMGKLDRIVRISFAVLIIVLFAMKEISGIWGVILLIFSGIFLITGFVGFCPLYSLFGWKTTKLKKH